MSESAWERLHMATQFPWREACTWDDGNPGKRPCILLMLNIFHGLPYVPTTFDEAETWIPTQHTKFHKDKKGPYRPQRRRNEKRRFSKAGDFSLQEMAKISGRQNTQRKQETISKKALQDPKNLEEIRRIFENKIQCSKNPADGRN